MNVLSRIVSGVNLKHPDGRPLFRYPLPPEVFSELEISLRSQVALGRKIELLAPAFVLWAAEHIRSRFTGGSLSWTFVLDPLNLPSDDQNLVREITKQGLSWWNREIKQTNTGTRMFLYSIVAEGGIPEALLKETGLYRNVVMGLLAEIEAEGGSGAEAWAEQIASRWISRLPQTFQSSDMTRLLAGLTLSLAELRALLPYDLPEAAAEQWLNKHRPGWTSSVPLRMTSEVAEGLIRPALQAERDTGPLVAGPLSRRELRLGGDKNWLPYLILHESGWLSERYFPDARDLRLRLLPTEAENIEGVGYSAAPGKKGWHLRRLGKAGKATIQLMIDAPFALAAFADGRLKGEAVIDAGVLNPIESPSFWRAVEMSEGAAAEQLTPVRGPARTRGPCLWLLTSNDEEPEVGGGWTLDDCEPALGGHLWRISGSGTVRVGEKWYRVETGAKEDAPEVNLFSFGKTLRGWRIGGNIPAYRGEVDIHGQIGATPLTRVAKHELRRIQGRNLCNEIIEWVREGQALARCRVVRLPQNASLNLREEAAGRITLSVSGLEAGWRLQFSAGNHKAISELQGGSAELKLETPGRTPGLVHLRLSEPATGRSIVLQAAWPTRNGMILDPDGNRLDRNQSISVEALQGWRVLTPDRIPGDLQLQLGGHRLVSLPVEGEAPLAIHSPLLRTMLAQGGPDAQVNLSLVVFGQEGPRLEVRRYHDLAVVHQEMLRMGLERDKSVIPETALASQLNKTRRAILCAVDLSNSDRIGPIETEASVDLENHLGGSGGPWLLQSTLEGQVQRAAVWNPRKSDKGTREDRIDAYAVQWQNLVCTPEDPDWDRLWDLISAAQQFGDSGTLDQVQALARAPVAAISLLLRHDKDPSSILSLEEVVPLYWPTLTVRDFVAAIKTEYARLQQKLLPYLDESEVGEVIDRTLVRRIGDIVNLRPELAGHFCHALIVSNAFERAIGIADCRNTIKALLLPLPAERLAEAAQEAAKRFDRLPQGVSGLKPLDPPVTLPSFNTYAQPVINAPLVVAEMATGRRPAPSPQEKYVLFILRLIDPLYFDTALPAALALYLSSDCQ